MNLRDLEYFVAVAELGHFSAAAERCCVSQPTLSGQLRKLEAELGQDLFERDTRNVRLTVFGKEILALARGVCSGAEAIERKALEQKDPFQGPVRLGAFPTLAPWLLPRIAPWLREDFPQAAFYLVEEKSPTLLAQLADKSLDAAWLALPQDSPELECLPVFSESFWLAVPAQHPWAARAAVAAAELNGTQLLLLADGHCLRDQALDLCRRFGAQEHGEFRATSLETLRQMVRLGAGITLMPSLAIPEHSEPGLRYLGVCDEDFHRDIGLCFRRTHPRRRLFLALAERVRLACGRDLALRALPLG